MMMMIMMITIIITSRKCSEPESVVEKEISKFCGISSYSVIT